uniref:Uncharacterized protein n=1 Tax=Arundo donax TaxID=35708 RepID=A0A0A8YR62_ARUDO
MVCYLSAISKRTLVGLKLQ